MPVELISANHAAALSATLAARANRVGRGFCSGVYPITPATDCMEYLCARKIEKGTVVRVESEHSAMGVCIGAAASGARSFTTTSSNGLAYMAENCITAAALRLPVIMAVANRTMGPPWNIWADHGDSLMLRDLGWIQFYCADNQEVFDTVLCAFRLGEDPRVMMPVMICMDGFILSHTIAQIMVPEQEDIDRFLPAASIPHQLAQSMGGLSQLMGNGSSRKKSVDVFLFRHHDLGNGMRQNKAVHADHHRHHYPGVLSEPKSTEYRIKNLLIVGAIKLYPAKITQHQGITVIGPDIPGRPHGPVGHSHDHRQPQGGRGDTVLRHIGQTV